MNETLAGALLGAAGGLAFGSTFGVLWWATAATAGSVPASAWAGTWAAAVAGGVASFSNFWFGGEPIGWGELLARVRNPAPSQGAGRPPLPAYQASLLVPANGEGRPAPR